MIKRIGFVCLLAVLGVPAWGASILLQDTFSEDDAVALIPFSISADDLVTLQSYSYAGGTAPGGTVVPEGGFPVNIVLFDSTGTWLNSDNGGHCGVTGTDSVTGGCNDAYIQMNLAAGSYTLALTVYDNVASGDLSDGFKQQGNPGFTCAEFGLTGEFCDTTSALGVPRTGSYALSISAADLVTSPEPSSLFLISAAGFLTIVQRMRKQK